MTDLQLHHASIVVGDLDAAVAFFAELGMELEGRAPIEGEWADRINAVDGLRVEIAMMRVPNGEGRLELTKFYSPSAISAEPAVAPSNTLGLRSIMFVVDDVDASVAALGAHGAELVGEIVEFENVHRLCYVRGPEGIILALSQDLNQR